MFCSQSASPKTLSFAIPESQGELDELLADTYKKVATILESERMKADGTETQGCQKKKKQSRCFAK